MLKHKDTCKLQGQNYEDGLKGCCQKWDHSDWLIHISPDFFWFDIQNVGEYQGQVFGVAVYNKQIAIYEDYYGSCELCGSWGGGGEPTSQEEVIKLCKFFNTKDEAIKYAMNLDVWNEPNTDEFVNAIKEADEFINSKVWCCLMCGWFGGCKKAVGGRILTLIESVSLE